MRGACREAMRVALDHISSGRSRSDTLQEERGWKLFLLVPRLLFFRPGRGGIVPKRKLEERVNQFAAGEWLSLLMESNSVASNGSTRRRRRNPDEETKALRAERLALGELSAARQAEIAPGNLATLAELTNPDRRPARPREVVPPNLMRFQPDEPSSWTKMCSPRTSGQHAEVRLQVLQE